MSESEVLAAVVLIGLGSNQRSNRGSSVQTVEDAMAELQSYAVGDSFRRSSLWRTAPVDCPPDSGDFINAAVSFLPEEQLTPEALLVALKTMESRYGRGAATVKNAPRELDLDLLVFGQEQRAHEQFQLPHPRAIQRRFVLAPAAEVAADLVWPGDGRCIAELLAALDNEENVVRLG